MIFDLAQDFHDALAAIPRRQGSGGQVPQEHPKLRILELLQEAIRRDIHFIDRHPTTLFQCMWNSCWWYDCPEAAEHMESGPLRPDRTGFAVLTPRTRLMLQQTAPLGRSVGLPSDVTALPPNPPAPYGLVRKAYTSTSSASKGWLRAGSTVETAPCERYSLV